MVDYGWVMFLVNFWKKALGFFSISRQIGASEIWKLTQCLSKDDQMIGIELVK